MASRSSSAVRELTLTYGNDRGRRLLVSSFLRHGRYEIIDIMADGGMGVMGDDAPPRDPGPLPNPTSTMYAHEVMPPPMPHSMHTRAVKCISAIGIMVYGFAVMLMASTPITACNVLA